MRVTLLHEFKYSMPFESCDTCELLRTLCSRNSQNELPDK